MDEFLSQFQNPRIIKPLLIHSWIGVPWVYRVTAPEHLHGQAKDLDEMRERLEAEIEKRLENRWYLPDVWNDLLRLLGMTETPECQAVMRYISETEKGYPAIIVPNGPAPARPRTTSTDPASESQIKFIRNLGGPRKFEGTKAEASELIDQLKQRKAA